MTTKAIFPQNFAGWCLQSISLYFWNKSFVVVPCYKLLNVLLIKRNRFGLLESCVKIKGELVYFLLPFQNEVLKELSTLSSFLV